MQEQTAVIAAMDEWRRNTEDPETSQDGGPGPSDGGAGTGGRGTDIRRRLRGIKVPSLGWKPRLHHQRDPSRLDLQLAPGYQQGRPHHAVGALAANSPRVRAALLAGDGEDCGPRAAPRPATGRPAAGEEAGGGQTCGPEAGYHQAAPPPAMAKPGGEGGGRQASQRQTASPAYAEPRASRVKYVKTTVMQ